MDADGFDRLDGIGAREGGGSLPARRAPAHAEASPDRAKPPQPHRAGPSRGGKGRRAVTSSDRMAGHRTGSSGAIEGVRFHLRAVAGGRGRHRPIPSSARSGTRRPTSWRTSVPRPARARPGAGRAVRETRGLGAAPRRGETHPRSDSDAMQAADRPGRRDRPRRGSREAIVVASLLDRERPFATEHRASPGRRAGDATAAGGAVRRDAADRRSPVGSGRSVVPGPDRRSPPRPFRRSPRLAGASGASPHGRAVRRASP